MGRTLSQILGDAKVGVKPTHDECYWALLALDALGTLDYGAIRRLTKLARPGMPKQLAAVETASHFQRNKSALAAEPKVWLGPDHDPTRPEVAQRVKASRALVDRLSATPTRCGRVLSASMGMAQMAASCKLPEGHDGECKEAPDA